MGKVKLKRNGPDLDVANNPRDRQLAYMLAGRLPGDNEVWLVKRNAKGYLTEDALIVVRVKKGDDIKELIRAEAEEAIRSGAASVELLYRGSNV